MKNIYIRFISLIIIIFSGCFLNAQVIQINQTFSGDTVFAPFSGSIPVYYRVYALFYSHRKPGIFVLRSLLFSRRYSKSDNVETSAHVGKI